MQGRTVGSPRNVTGQQGRFGSGRADAITAQPMLGRAHGSVPALARSVLTISLIAGGLSAALIGSGVDLGKVGLSQAVSSAQAATEPPMPRPRIHTVALSEELERTPLRASASFAAVHDLDTAVGSNGVDRVSYDFLLSESAGGDPNDILEFGPMKIRRHLVQTIVRAAQAVQTDPVLLMAVADKESSFVTAVQAKTSSATGLYQFIERTWLGVVRDFGAKYGLEKEAALVTADANDRPAITDAAERARVLELRRDPYLSALMAGEMLKRDAGRIAQRIGRELTLGEVYLAHFLGADDAGEFLANVVNKPAAAAAVLLPGPARANRSIFFAAGRFVGRGRHRKPASLSVAQVHEKFEAMMSTRGTRYQNVQAVSGIMAYADAATGVATQ
ncbi:MULTISPECIES: transglycosylase SLT domain-containing protein [unclassified Methylobacterium]|uniref:transglycosylase SLT domain-containing protein n=1 Tax=unclassified Methylobacterium TaxID=2615210 RepID=UPI0011C203F6|nr:MULTISPECIES: transglycosylase SLT domain-containing protein [unclassified Methylobacterium]QEE40425.1 transglycosylase SLT domain protein [Methylobacterium sp. WL1]TXN01151.1 transglycosylase SLT domain-containing protein [Methylobacterium sp. WL64]TXN54358.1 transglycosylase SLT domain-containing protein [Methylobacterium sp. WL2]